MCLDESRKEVWSALVITWQPILWFQIFVVLNFRVLAGTSSVLNFRGCKEDASIIHIAGNAWMWQKGTHQREVDKASISERWTGPTKKMASSLQFPCSPFEGWQLCCATSIVCHCRYDAQQVLRAAKLLIGLTPSSLLIRPTVVPPGCSLDRHHFH